MRSAERFLRCPSAYELLLLFHRELIDVDITDPETVGGAPQELHVPLIDLFGLYSNGLVLAGLQHVRPHVQSLGEVRLQRLNAGDHETRLRGMFVDYFD